jgi:lactoylglutathione lyase
MSAAANGVELRLRHTMLPVRNLKESVDFYTRVMGMNVLRERPDRGDGRSIAYVGFGNDEGATHALELIQGQAEPGKTWYGHLAFAVSDLLSFSTFLKAEGVVFTKDVQEPSVHGGNRRVAWIKDPDGFAIELTERHHGINS